MEFDDSIIPKNSNSIMLPCAFGEHLRSVEVQEEHPCGFIFKATLGIPQTDI